MHKLIYVEFGIRDLAKLSDVSTEETEPLRLQLKKEAYSEDKIDEVLSRWEIVVIMKLLYIYLENIFSVPLIDYDLTNSLMNAKSEFVPTRYLIFFRLGRGSSIQGIEENRSRETFREKSVHSGILVGIYRKVECDFNTK